MQVPVGAAVYALADEERDRSQATDTHRRDDEWNDVSQMVIWM